MKVLFQSRVDLYNPRGGDTSQMEHTKAAIEKIDPDIKIDINTETKFNRVKEYDIVHLFNLDWIPETYIQAKWAKKHRKKVVLSAIHHSEKEVVRFEKKAAYDIRKIYNSIFTTQPARDTGKNIYRSLFHTAKIKPTMVQILKGIRNEQRDILEMADMVLVQTEVEVKDIIEDFKFSDFRWTKIVNGVDVDVFGNAVPDTFNKVVGEKYKIDIKDNPILLSVGRIEPRKNQLTLIKAFDELSKEGKLSGYYLIFIGALTNHSFEYVSRFKNLLKRVPRILYFETQPQNVVASAMSHKGIYVHPSWFETTGLVTLEAALAGMNVVATGERTKEYLGDSANYADPESIDSFKNAILNGVFSPKPTDSLCEKIKQQYSWENTAKQTIEVYKNLYSTDR